MHSLREEKTFLRDKKNGDFRFLDVFSTKDPLRRSENILIAFSVVDYILGMSYRTILRMTECAVVPWAYCTSAIREVNECVMASDRSSPKKFSGSEVKCSLL